MGGGIQPFGDQKEQCYQEEDKSMNGKFDEPAGYLGIKPGIDDVEGRQVEGKSSSGKNINAQEQEQT